MSLTFDSDEHIYRWRGVVVPSVTQVIGDAVDLSMVPRETLERKRQIGEALHSCIRMNWTGSLDPDSIDEPVRPYFSAFEDWLSSSISYGRFDLHGYEQPLYSERFGYAGTPDIWSAYLDSLAVMDPKTVAGTLGPHVGLQLAAYRQLLVENFGAQWSAAKLYGLQLTKEGKCKPIEFDERTDWAAFCGALAWWKWRRKHGII